jgi:CBS-domain-containing membrane protein
MTSNVVTVKPDDTVEQAARLMYHLQVKRLPVVDAGGCLVGIVSRADLLTVTGGPETADLGHRIVDKIRHVQGVVAVHDKLRDPPAEASFAGLHF